MSTAGDVQVIAVGEDESMQQLTPLIYKENEDPRFQASVSDEGKPEPKMVIVSPPA